MVQKTIWDDDCEESKLEETAPNTSNFFHRLPNTQIARPLITSNIRICGNIEKANQDVVDDGKIACDGCGKRF